MRGRIRDSVPRLQVAPLELLIEAIGFPRLILVSAGPAPQLIPKVDGGCVFPESPGDSRFELQVPLRPRKWTKSLRRLNMLLQRKLGDQAPQELRSALSPAKLIGIHCIAISTGRLHDCAGRRRLKHATGDRRNTCAIRGRDHYAGEYERLLKLKRLETDRIRVDPPSTLQAQEFVAKEIGEAGIRIVACVLENARGREYFVGVENNCAIRHSLNGLISVQMKRMPVAEKGRDGKLFHLR